MSKIVILGAQLGAPQIIDDLLKKIAAKDPAMAEWIKHLDTVPIIRECVSNALTRVSQMNGIQKGTRVEDYYGNAYSGKLDGILKTKALSRGLGIQIASNGMVKFIADEYRSEWKREIKRLRELFTDAFTAEITSSILQILGYQVEIQASSLGNGTFCYNLEGVKQ